MKVDAFQLIENFKYDFTSHMMLIEILTISLFKCIAYTLIRVAYCIVIESLSKRPSTFIARE